MNRKNIHPLAADDIPPNPLTASRIGILIVSAIIAIVIYAWSFKAVEFSFHSLVVGADKMLNFLSGMFPPDLTILNTVFHETLVTIQLALVGTTISVIIAFP